ncbi:ribosome small subunit-dependent GTPase A [Pseudoxanthomonas kalamensis DSM 18571]|uniref:ribosome small subunit-dependent GTPase A n=1 Tax=Pseudoxanthomonas kalamensis TaxID=289483 RepID=UPI0013920377|nr:ribosome small subunit-dependent GTPase A [Pseudoxanthomonas kalamensis]KAF1712542.1 ribosome small subunit-dependent GTPase A [Pseudoxanthomonas kalamensis DSM 18571]
MTSNAVDFAVLHRIGWPAAGEAEEPAWSELLAAHPQARPARVVEQHRSGYVVADAPGVALRAESPPEWLRRPAFRKGEAPMHERAAVGDWVLLEDVRIVALLPRHSVIKRGAAGEHYQQQVIAANIDTVFVVCGLDEDFNPRRIERYLLLVGGGGAEPVVVLTKADRGADVEAALAGLADIAAQGVPVLAVNAKDRDSVTALDPWLGPGRSVVLVGSSGAGKSTLANTLLGEQKMKTGKVRESDSRGRHTTTHRALIALPGGACLIDTPGMRELKPTGEEDLAEGGFADIEALARECRFRDCSHRQEPGCALRAAVERGELDPARLQNYLKLEDEVAGAADRLATRLAQKAQARTQGKALNKRLDEKYGKH